MNIYKQLIRQPIKTTVLLFLLTAASTFLSLSLGIFLSARETTKEIESQFLTIALPTNETETVPMEVGNGLTVNLEQSVISHDFHRGRNAGSFSCQSFLSQEIQTMEALPENAGKNFARTQESHHELRIRQSPSANLYHLPYGAVFLLYHGRTSDGEGILSAPAV